jgi:predicted nucleic acid-binding protein
MILDTSVLIEIMADNQSVKRRLTQLGGRVATTVISKYELLKWHDDKAASGMLSIMDSHPFDGTASERSARIYKELKRSGKMINELDILIASIAIARDELLVTLDGDFKSVEHLKLLVL